MLCGVASLQQFNVIVQEADARQAETWELCQARPRKKLVSDSMSLNCLR